VTAIIAALSTLRLQASPTEAAIHAAIADALTAAGVAFEHELVLGPGARVDFLCDGGVAIEVKKGKPPRKSLEAQAARYAAFADVSAIVLVVERCLFQPPPDVNDKPVVYLSLSKRWGIAL